MKRELKTGFCVLVFVMAAGLSYLGVSHWSKSAKQATTPGSTDTIADIDGFVAGDVVDLPQMRMFTREASALDEVPRKRILFAFFTPSCEGCSLDVALWKSLNEEAAKRSTVFLLVDVSNDRVALHKFVEAYDLGSLPIAVSDDPSVGKMLKVNIVPQYLLIDNRGNVLHRWDGVQHNKQFLFANGNTN